MLAQLPPSLSQRTHWNWNLSGLLLQLPRSPVSTLSSCGVPEMVGGDVFTGLSALAATPEPANAASEATTTAATPAPKAAPIAVQRFLCVVCMSYPFRLLVLSIRRFPRRAVPNGAFSKGLHLPRGGVNLRRCPPISRNAPWNWSISRLRAVQKHRFSSTYATRCRCRSPTEPTR